MEFALRRSPPHGFSLRSNSSRNFHGGGVPLKEFPRGDSPKGKGEEIEKKPPLYRTT